MKIARALISVSDKTGIASFARALERQGIDVISTGGTAELLRKEKIPVREISSFTAFPEVLEGRVKTLHPRVHGGLLYKRGNPKHEAEARECGFEPIDLVVVNLYPFEATIVKPDVTLSEAIENIDIGGPSMIRSAAKNYESVLRFRSLCRWLLVFVTAKIRIKPPGSTAILTNILKNFMAKNFLLITFLILARRRT